jgi:hypothetical protein
MSYPTLVRDCLVCGATYTTTSAARLYCSGKCRGAKHRGGYSDITPDSVKYRDRVLKMLARGDSQREVAKQLNIHRRTVERIKAEANGTVKSDTVFAPFTVEPYRCSGCESAGVKFVTTWKPCVRCAARKAVPK